MGAESTRVLICRCAQVGLTPDATLARLAQAASDAGVSAEWVDDLCELAAHRSPRLAEWAASGDLRVAACYPRAVRWLFEAAGVTLPRAGVTLANARTEPADEVAERLFAGATPGDAVEAPAEGAGEWPAWFPVIDRDRCIDCMQCLDFCLFGVYGEDGGRVVVQSPEKCKTNCPACARVCPEVAIVFPRYGKSPINGDEGRGREPDHDVVTVSISSLLSGDMYSKLRDRNARAKERFSPERSEEVALQERQRCLAELQEKLDIPPELLESLRGELPGGAEKQDE